MTETGPQLGFEYEEPTIPARKEPESPKLNNQVLSKLSKQTRTVRDPSNGSTYEVPVDK